MKKEIGSVSFFLSFTFSVNISQHSVCNLGEKLKGVVLL